MLVLLKNNMNYFKDSTFKCFLRSVIGFFLMLYFTAYNDVKFKS